MTKNNYSKELKENLNKYLNELKEREEEARKGYEEAKRKAGMNKPT